RWFDGFRILKLIHHLRDTAYPMIDMFDALDEMFAKQKINFDVKRMQNEIPSIEIQKKYLFTLRKLDSYMIIKSSPDEIQNYLVDASNFKRYCDAVYLPSDEKDIIEIVKEPTLKKRKLLRPENKP